MNIYKNGIELRKIHKRFFLSSVLYFEIKRIVFTKDINIQPQDINNDEGAP